MFGNTMRYLASDIAGGGWGTAIDEATYFCQDNGYMGGAVDVWPAGDVDFVYSYIAGPPPYIYSGHILPNVEVQREVHCVQ